jgi:hypothetical protein
MFETYRLFGRAHEEELERMAAPRHSSPVPCEPRFARLVKRISRPRTRPAVESGQIQGIAPSNTSDAPVSAATSAS